VRIRTDNLRVEAIAEAAIEDVVQVGKLVGSFLGTPLDASFLPKKGVPGERLPEKNSVSPAALFPGHIAVSSLN
jgi:hypothetical protein